MLHALGYRKASLRAFRGAGIRVPLEDVVTSTIFGPLDFMQSSDRSEALKHLFHALSVNLICDWGTAQIRFWPKRPLTGDLRASYVEPDAVIEDRNGIVLIVEVKWGAPLGPYELAAQWSTLNGAERRRAKHLLIVNRPGAYGNAVEIDRTKLKQMGKQPWNLVVKSWGNVAHALDCLAADYSRGSVCKYWAKQVAQVLRREEGTYFRGWDEIELNSVERLEWKFVRRWFSNLEPVPTPFGWWRD